MKGYTMTNKLTTVQQVLPTDFVQSEQYTVIEPGLSKFNQDQTITHNELIEYLKDQPLNTINVLPMLTESK
jgi:hypothetical protein